MAMFHRDRTSRDPRSKDPCESRSHRLAGLAATDDDDAIDGVQVIGSGPDVQDGALQGYMGANGIARIHGAQGRGQDVEDAVSIRDLHRCESDLPLLGWVERGLERLIGAAFTSQDVKRSLLKAGRGGRRIRTGRPTDRASQLSIQEVDIGARAPRG